MLETSEKYKMHGQNIKIYKNIYRVIPNINFQLGAKCCYWLRRRQYRPYWPHYKAIVWSFLRTVAFNAAATAVNDNAKLAAFALDLSA
jgi:hypothetical protein